MATGNFLAVFNAHEGLSPSTNGATADVRNNHRVMDFDTTTQEILYFEGRLPDNYAGGGVTVELEWAASSATSGTIGWDVAFEKVEDGTQDMDSDGFASAATITAVTVPGTSGATEKSSVNISDGANMDSVGAGQSFRLRVRRDVANDTAAGDAELLNVSIKEQ